MAKIYTPDDEPGRRPMETAAPAPPTNERMVERETIIEPVDTPPAATAATRPVIAESGRKGGVAMGMAPPMSPLAPVAAPPRADTTIARPRAETDARPIYEVRAGRAIFAGLLGTAFMTAIEWVGPMLFGGPMLDMSDLLGQSMLPRQPGLAYIAGWGGHLAIGALSALLYASVLRGAHKQSTAGRGLAFGVLLWLAASFLFPILMGLLPGVQTANMANPGLFLLRLGLWAPITWLISHLAYGLTVGAVYKHRERERLLP